VHNKIVEATPSPTPAEIVNEPVVIPGGPGGGGGGVPVASIGGSPTPSATPTVTPTATPTSTPSAGKTPAASPTPAPVVTDTNSLDFFTDIKGHWAQNSLLIC